MTHRNQCRNASTLANSRAKNSCWILTVPSARSSYKLLDEAPWEGKTASGHWQTRDLCGHLIDVTEGYLDRFALARAGQGAPAPLGLPGMAQKLDEGATRFRSLSKDQAIARLQSSSDKLFEIFDALDEQSWSGEIVPHVFMGPLPAYFFAAFQLLDYSIHSWDIKVRARPRRAAVGRRRDHADPVHADRDPVHRRRAARRGSEGEVRHQDHRPGRRHLVRRRRRHRVSLRRRQPRRLPDGVHLQARASSR